MSGSLVIFPSRRLWGATRMSATTPENIGSADQFFFTPLIKHDPKMRTSLTLLISLCTVVHASMTCREARTHFEATCCNQDLESTYFIGPIHWTFDTTYDADSISVLQAERMAALVKEATHGRFIITVNASMPGGNFGRVAGGGSEMGTAYLSAFGAIGVFDTQDPLLVWDNVPVEAAAAPTVDDAVNRWTSDVEEPFRALYEQVAPASTFLLGGLPSAGQGFFLNRTLTPDVAADFSGLTVRCYSAVVGQLTSALNMSCSPRILQSAIPQAFDDGIIQGLWGSADTVVAKELWTKGLKTFVAMRTFYPFIYTVVHKTSYEQLDPEARQALDAAWHSIWTNTTAVVKEREAQGDVILGDNGIEIVPITDARVAEALDAASTAVRGTWEATLDV